VKLEVGEDGFCMKGGKKSEQGRGDGLFHAQTKLDSVTLL
jgi:hypothetical protein